MISLDSVNVIQWGKHQYLYDNWWYPWTRLMLYSEDNTHQYLYDNWWYPWTRLMLYSEGNTPLLVWQLLISLDSVNVIQWGKHTTTCMTIVDIPGLCQCYTVRETHHYLYDNCWYPWTLSMLYSEENTPVLVWQLLIFTTYKVEVYEQYEISLDSVNVIQWGKHTSTCMTIGDIPGLC